MASPDSQGMVSSPKPPSIAPTIRSASSINNALLQQLALPSPSPAKGPASLNAALQNMLHHGSAFTLNSAQRRQGHVRIPYAFPMTASQKAKAKLEEKEQRFKNLVVLALVLVTASSVGQYWATAEAGDDARSYAGVMARAINKREWDLAFQKDCGTGKRGRGDEVGGRRKRVKLSSSVTSVSDEVAFDEAENPFIEEPQKSSEEENEDGSENEEEIPHLVNLEFKNEEIESDVSLCVHAAQAVMAALASALEWFEDKYVVEDRRQPDVGEEDNASEASNPFLESPVTKPKRQDPSSPSHEEESGSPLESITELFAIFVTAWQTSLFVPYASGDFTTPDSISFSTTAPIKHLLQDERDRMRVNLPVDHARVKRDLDKAHLEALKAERKWAKRKNDAGRRAVGCIASVAKGIIAGLDGGEEEFRGLDGEDSDSEEEEDLSLKASLVTTMAIVQVALVASVTTDKRSTDTSGVSQNYLSPSPLSLSQDPSLRSRLVTELTRTQKKNRTDRAAKERDEMTKRKNVRAGVAKVTCQMARGVWDSLVHESLLQRGEWETQAEFWSDMKGLEDGDGGDGEVDEDEEERKFIELERAALATLKLLGYGNFKLFSNLFNGIDEWENPNPVNFAGMNHDEDDEEIEEEEEAVEPLDPERMGKLSGNEKISSWLRSVTSSPTTTPDALDEALGEEEMTELGEPEAAVAADSAEIAERPEVTSEKGIVEGHEDVAEEEPRAVATRKPKTKQSGNAKLASMWRTKKRLSKAKKGASAKALEKAKEEKIRRKLEERERVEAEERGNVDEGDERLEAVDKKGGKGERKTNRLSVVGMRKRRSKAQKEQAAKALEKAREASKAKQVRKA